jgi:hypothetical protein
MIKPFGRFLVRVDVNVAENDYFHGF